MNEFDRYDVIVVGCGLSGVFIAKQFSSIKNQKVLIIDKRKHIVGNCYDYIDKETNILLNNMEHIYSIQMIMKFINT
jgi:UDP-galactopyranose mutase